MYKVQRVRENGTVILKPVKVLASPKPKPIPVRGTLLNGIKLDERMAQSQKEVSDAGEKTVHRGKGSW